LNILFSKSLSIVFFLLFAVLLSACNELETDLQKLETPPSEQEVKEKDNEKASSDPIEGQVIAEDDTKKNSEDDYSVTVKLVTEELPDRVITIENDVSVKSDVPAESEFSPTIEGKNEISYDVEDYETINESIAELADSEYSMFRHSDNFVISPTITFTLANFLEFSAAGESRATIQRELGWDDEDDWSLALWSYNITAERENGYAIVSNRTWGQTDYLFSEDYLTSLSDNFMSDFVSVDYIELDNFYGWASTITYDSDAQTMTFEGEDKVVVLENQDGTIQFDDATGYFGREDRARAEIDAWLPVDLLIENDELTKSIASKTRISFASKISLDTAWSEDTRTISEIEGLWSAGDELVKLPMFQWAGEFRRYDTEAFRSVIIPLADEQTSMTIIMPVDETNFSVIENNLFAVLKELEENHSEIKMDFVLPHFSVRSDSGLQDIIPDAGFVNESEATINKAPVDDLSVSMTSGTSTHSLSPDVTEIFYDYSGVNEKGFLIRNSVEAVSTLTVTTEGVVAESAGLTSLNGTNDEPITLFSNVAAMIDSDYLNYSGVFVSSSTHIYNACEIKEEIVGDRQASPFLFIIRDLASNSILQMGRINSLPGEAPDYREVCEAEFVDVEDNIWPTYPKKSPYAQKHINTSDYEPKNVFVTVMPDEDAVRKLVNEVYNPLALSIYKTNEDNNFVVTPITHGYVQAMAQTGNTNDDLLSGLVLDNHSAIHPAKYLANLVQNQTWMEADYELVENYLDTLSFFGNDFQTMDILHHSSELEAVVDRWTNNTFNNNSLLKLISQLTRVVIGSSFHVKGEIEAESFLGNFSDGESHWLNVPMLKFSGEYSSLQSEDYRATEIPLVESNKDLLLIMPEAGKFDLLEGSLSEVLTQFDTGATKKVLSEVVPQFSLSTDYSKQFDQEGFLKNVSEHRPLNAKEQFTEDRFTFTSDGITAESYSLSSLVIPGNNFLLDYYPPHLIYIDPDSIALGCDTVEEASRVDARPYIFVLRDRLSKAILQIGRIKEPQGGVATPVYCIHPVINTLNGDSLFD